MSCYIVQEIDGTSRFILEDGSGFLVLEDCVPTATGQAVMGGTPEAVAEQMQAARELDGVLRRRKREADDEDFAFLLTEL